MPYDATTNIITDPNSGFAYTPNAAGLANYQATQTPTSSAISLDQLNSAAPINVPPAPTTVDPLAGAAAGATQTTKSLQDYINQNTPTPTALDATQQSLIDSISQLSGQDVGRGQAQLQAEQAAGLPQQKTQLAQINAQLLQKVAEATKTSASYDQIVQQLENQQGIPMSIITGQQAQQRKLQLAENTTNAANIGLLQAYAQGLAGNIQAAQDSVNRAIDLKYADIESQITAKQNQLIAIQPLLDKQERIQAAALQQQYNDQQQAIADKKAQDQIIQNMAIQAAQNGADSATLKAIGSAANPVAAAVNYAQFAKQQNNLKNFSQYTITSPFILTAGGEVQDTQSGYGFTSEQDFQKRTGMTVEQALAKGQIKPLGQTNAQQQQTFENNIALKQLGVSQYNATTSRLNAIQPKSSIVDLGDGTKAVVTVDNNGNIVNQQPLSSGSSGKSELQLAKSQDNISSVTNLLSDKALRTSVGPTAVARSGISILGLKLPTVSGAINTFNGANQNFVAGVEQLRSGLNLDALIKAKSQGATFGALSDQELRVLANTATKIGSWAIKDKNGNVTGYNANEKDFKNELQKINNFAKLDYVAKGGDPASVGVKVESNGNLTTINWDGSVTQIYP